MRLEDAQAMAEAHIKKHLPEGWTFGWSNQKRGFGICYHKPKRVMLSRYSIPYENEDATEQTILHEIAHALAGPKEGHSRKWKTIARSIGVRNPKATRKPTSTPDNRLEPKWVLICGDEIQIEYHRKPTDRTFQTMHLRAIVGKPETKGKLQIVYYADYKRGVRTMPTVTKVTKREPAWVIVYAGEIVKRYYRKPNRKVFDGLPDMYLPRRGAHTAGKLELMPYRDYQRAKLNRTHFK